MLTLWVMTTRRLECSCQAQTPRRRGGSIWPCEVCNLGFGGKLRLRASAADVVLGSPTQPLRVIGTVPWEEMHHFGQSDANLASFLRTRCACRSPIPRPFAGAATRQLSRCIASAGLTLALRSAALTPGHHMCPSLSTISAVSISHAIFAPI